MSYRICGMVKRLIASQIFKNEKLYRDRYGIIAGVDEAGRGPLAGPVVVAACILKDFSMLEKMNDSKKMTAGGRDEIYEVLVRSAEYAVRIIEPAEIDRINILQATLKGMRDSVNNLGTRPRFVLIDGNKIPADISVEAEAIVKGDGKVACIAAASIIAKVARDRIMIEIDKEFPQYGFASHKGYPTKEHLCAIAEYGICKYHRLSFKPVLCRLSATEQTEIDYPGYEK